MSKILIIDDHFNSRFVLVKILKKEGFDVSDAESGEKAIQLINKENYDLIITDLKMDKVDGFDIIDYVKQNSPSTEVIVITAYATIPTAVKAMKLGAYDYISKPMQKEEIVFTVNKALEKVRLISEVKNLKSQLRENYNCIIGDSNVMQRVHKLIREITDLDVPVLIHGESGTGKELVAREIHYQSSRKSKPFIAINCGAIQDTLLESELFGHVKGSYTGAYANKTGLFKKANGGTLLLDEVGEMSLNAQTKLLRVIENSEIRPVGGNKSEKIDTRMIFATNSDLESKVKKGQFRQDLLFRINIFPIELPPLRDRKDDITLLTNYFLAKYSKKYSKKIDSVSEIVYNKLMSYHWPGNIRELENIIERAVIIAKDDRITIEEINLNKKQEQQNFDNLDILNSNTLGDIEKEVILKRLEKNDWNKSKTAKELDIGTTTLWRKINKYNLLSDNDIEKKPD